MARARMVAVVVPSPATSDVLEATTLTSLAPMFSNGSLSSISFETVTPSLVTSGPPNDLLENDVAPGRAERRAHGLGQDVDAAEHLAATGVGKEQLLCHGRLLLEQVGEFRDRLRCRLT